MRSINIFAPKRHYIIMVWQQWQHHIYTIRSFGCLLLRRGNLSCSVNCCLIESHGAKNSRQHRWKGVWVFFAKKIDTMIQLKNKFVFPFSRARTLDPWTLRSLSFRADLCAARDWVTSPEITFIFEFRLIFFQHPGDNLLSSKIMTSCITESVDDLSTLFPTNY